MSGRSLPTPHPTTGPAGTDASSVQVQPAVAALVASVAVCVAITAYDTAMASSRAPSEVTWGLPFAAFGLATVAILPLTYVFVAARTWAANARKRRMFVSVVEGLAFGLPVFIFETWDSLTSALLYGSACVFILGKLTFALFPRKRWVRSAVKLLVLGACVFALLWLPWRQKPLFRMVTEVNAAILLAGLWIPHVQRLGQVVVRSVIAGAALLAALGLILFSTQPRLPIAILNTTTQSQAAATLILEHCPDCLDKRTVRFGPFACASRNTSCYAREDSKRTNLSGRAKGADVLLLSLDSLRGDYAHLLEPLVGQLGNVVQFNRAMAPAPGTRLTFGSLWRGRNVRRVPFSEKVLHGGVEQDGTATLASVLAAHGYRAVHIPTHRFFNPAAGLTTGFELSYADRQAPLSDRNRGMERVAFRDALRHALEIASKTHGPLLLWSHAMESHYPYGGNQFPQPQTKQGHQASVTFLVNQIREFLPQFRALRQNRPLIVAIFGDHGEEFGEHGGDQHSSTVHLEQVHVSWLLAGPSLMPRVVTSPVSLASMPATVLDWLGEPIACDFDIPSVLACIEDASECPEVVESSSPRRGGLYGYTTANLRLIAQRRSNLNSLYDVATDPGEQEDLYNREEFQRNQLYRVQQSILNFDRKYCVKNEKQSGGD